MIEQEVKLQFESLEAARLAVHAAGGRLVRSRRLQDDQFLDTDADTLSNARMALRLRREPDLNTLTFKGPMMPGPVKSREEIETTVADATIMETLLNRLGFAEWWRIHKHREDYVIDDVAVFVDDTPVGVFVEIEGTPSQILNVARRLGRSTSDYILDSYRTLYTR